MKKTITVTFFGLLAFSASAQVISTDMVQPKTVAVVEEPLGIAETTFDFGKIPQGKPHRTRAIQGYQRDNIFKAIR